MKTNKVKHWTKFEHNIFLLEYIKYGNKWSLFKNLHNFKTKSQIRSHAQKFFKKNKLRFNLNKDELLTIRSLIELKSYKL